MKIKLVRFLVAFALCALSGATSFAADARNRIFLSSLAMMSGRPTSAPTRTAWSGYKTPNIDRIAREGMMFTDYYAENSCTAGRSTFITGQAPLRTGLSKVGLPGVAVGLQKVDITIAQAIKAQGYATGQFGKNHLGRPQRIPADRSRLR